MKYIESIMYLTAQNKNKKQGDITVVWDFL